MRRFDIIPIVGHGSTNLIDIPLITLLSHLLSAILIKNLNIVQRRRILLLSSVRHISQDFYFTKYSIPLSILLNWIWLKNKMIAIYYLSFFHTPLHYYNSFQISKKNRWKLWGKISLAILTTIGTIIGLKYNVDSKLNEQLGQFWWVSPILGHILCNEYTEVKNKFD